MNRLTTMILPKDVRNVSLMSVNYLYYSTFSKYTINTYANNTSYVNNKSDLLITTPRNTPKKMSESSNIGIVRHLHKLLKDIVLNYNMFQYACGNFEAVMRQTSKLTHKNSAVDNCCAFIYACKNGNLEIIRYLVQTVGPIYNSKSSALVDMTTFYITSNARLHQQNHHQIKNLFTPDSNDHATPSVQDQVELIKKLTDWLLIIMIGGF